MEPIKLTVSNNKESNQAELTQHAMGNEDVSKLRESTKKTFGFDAFDDKAFPVRERSFSWKKARVQLEEADAASNFPMLLRAGVNNIMVGKYLNTPVSYDEWTTTIATDMDETLFAPIHGITFPREVGVEGKYPEVTFDNLSIRIKSRKFGSMLAIQRELFEDDKTGQISQLSGKLAEYMRLLVEVYCYGKLASVSGARFQDLEIPQSETKPSYESTYPWAPSATALRGGGITRPTAFTALDQGAIQNAMIAMMAQKNLLGVKMTVNPDKILISPYNRFNLATLLNSTYWASGVNTTASQVGGPMAINPIESIADMVVSRYMFDHLGSAAGNSKAWYMIDSSVPWFVVCNRTPISVVAEAPNAGESFERDIYRFRIDTRFNADILDPRFSWQGNDGSVT